MSEQKWHLEKVSGGMVELLFEMEASSNRVSLEGMRKGMGWLEGKIHSEIGEMIKAGMPGNLGQVVVSGYIEANGGKLMMGARVGVKLERSDYGYDDVEEILTEGGWL